MRVAALYDIHGNLPALEAVLDEVRRAGVSRIVVGGDVLPGPMGRECLELLSGLDLPVDFIRGNGDRVVLAQMRGEDPTEVPKEFRNDIRWNARQLTAEHEKTVANWPATTRLAIERVGDVLFCHASPRNDIDIFTRSTPEDRLAQLFDGIKAAADLRSHSHAIRSAHRICARNQRRERWNAVRRARRILAIARTRYRVAQN